MGQERTAPVKDAVASWIWLSLALASSLTGTGCK